MAENKENQAAAEYPVTRLIEESHRFFGVESHVAAGAFHGSRKAMTVADAKKALETFKNRKVG